MCNTKRKLDHQEELNIQMELLRVKARKQGEEQRKLQTLAEEQIILLHEKYKRKLQIQEEEFKEKLKSMEEEYKNKLKAQQEDYIMNARREEMKLRREELELRRLEKAEELAGNLRHKVILSWVCSRCTFINIEGMGVCESCGDPAPDTAYKDKPMEQQLPTEEINKKEEYKKGEKMYTIYIYIYILVYKDQLNMFITSYLQ